MKQILAEGVWCDMCEFFEVEDFAADGTCLACGCSEDDHIRVEVVTTQ